MSIDQLRSRLAEHHHAVGLVVFGDRPGQVPQAQENLWTVSELDGGGFLVGGWERGVFAPYGEVAEAEAYDLLRVLLWPRLPGKASADRAELEARAAEAVAFLESGRDVGALPVGAVLERVGFETGHCLWPLGAPRELGPDDGPRTGYVLTGPLPAGTTAQRQERADGTVEWMITLPRVVRYCCDQGILSRFTLVPPPPPDADAQDDADQLIAFYDREADDRRRRFRGQPRTGLSRPRPGRPGDGRSG